MAKRVTGSVRTAFDLGPKLLETYDPEAGKYREGWSDDRIATELGVSVHAVASLRRGRFGNFKRPERRAEAPAPAPSIDEGLLLRLSAELEAARGALYGSKGALKIAREELAAARGALGVARGLVQETREELGAARSRLVVLEAWCESLARELGILAPRAA